MGSPIIWAGAVAKNLKAGLKFSDHATIFSGNTDPTSVAFTGVAGDVYISTTTFNLYVKQDSGSSVNWTPAGKLTSLASGRMVYTDGSGNLATDVGFTYNAGTDTLTVANLTVNGTTTTISTVNLTVTDKLVTVNSGGAAASGGASGIEVEENSVVTGYVKTSSDRNSWELKSPNTAGVATLTAGTSGITLDQSSHNPVTLTAVGVTPNANGASLSTQALTLQPADATFPGIVSATSQSFTGIKTFASGIKDGTLITNRAIITDGFSQLSVSATTAAEIGHVNGVTSSIQTQLGNRLLKATGDLNETSFSDNTETRINEPVTGFAFNNGTVRAFTALVSVVIDATSDLFEVFELKGIQRGADWAMAATSTGDASGVSFNITNAGIVQYSSGTYAGFVSTTIKFRALTTSF